MPYTWGYVGIIYNKKFVNEADLTGWELLWNNAYAGKILMFDNPATPSPSPRPIWASA